MRNTGIAAVVVKPICMKAIRFVDLGRLRSALNAGIQDEKLATPKTIQRKAHPIAYRGSKGCSEKYAITRHGRPLVS